MDHRHGDVLTGVGATGVPWPTEALWREIGDAFNSSLSRNTRGMTEARRYAASITHQYDLLADRFDDLAVLSCETCREPCCRHAKVWLDFTDLLYIHLMRVYRPPSQLRRNLYETCRFLGPRGCRLPRQSRPWICTWYICPTQRQILEGQIPAGMRQVSAVFARVKRLRKAMEHAFVAALGFSVPN